MKNDEMSSSPVYLGLLTMAAAMGGLLFGYDTGGDLRRYRRDS